MMQKVISLLALSLIGLSACQTAKQTNNATLSPDTPIGIAWLNSNKPSTDKLVIPYQKYRLDNGLTLVLHQDNSDPLVHVDVTYHVGSAREELGKSGFAHFFEHMMFQGSENVGDEQHFKIINEAGGNLNGTTNSDRTNYYQTVPSNQLEKVLWLEADRMGFLLDSVTQEKFETQRETVKNERAQRYDNRPYGLRGERVAEALYPKDHPYSWQTIGYVEDLDRVDVDDLKAFFEKWYGPNNATLTIGGNIDVQKTLAWVNKYFGSIPTGAAVEKPVKVPVTLSEDRYLTMEDQVHLPLLQVTYPTVYVRHEDEAPLDVLSNILGSGKTSLFYKNMVKNGHAVNAVVGHPCRELACQFQLIALPNPGKNPNLANLKTIIDQTLIEFEQRGVNQDDLDRTKASIESSTVFGLQSVAGKVSTLASNQVFDGEPDKVQFDLDRYGAVTKEDVMRVFRQYIKDKPAVFMSIVPDGKTELVAAPSNFTVGDRLLSKNEVKSEQGVVVAKIDDNFDRSKMPKASVNPIIKVPEFWQSEYDNGLTVMGHNTSETPTVSLTLSLEGGPLLETREKAGLARLTARLMNESTLDTSNEEMANRLALLGSSIGFGAGGRFTEITVSSLRKNLDETLEILQEKLFKPAFLEADFERLKQQVLQSQQQQVKDPGVLARRAVSKLLFGENNRVSLPDSGTMESVSNLNLEDVKAYYQQFYSPSMANLVVVGDISQKEVIDKIGFLTKWKARHYDIPEMGEFPQWQKPNLYFVNKEDAAQSVVRIIKPSLPYDATGENFRTKLMNFALGGNFNSRINLNLREDKGYTYGASSSFIGGKQLGWFQTGASVKQANTGDSLREMFDELNKYQSSGMTESELMSMQSAFTQSDALKYETPGQKAGFLRHLLVHNLDKVYAQQQNDIIRSIGITELNALASKHLKLDDMQIVVVGDEKTVLPQLTSLSREVITLDIPL